MSHILFGRQLSSYLTEREGTYCLIHSSDNDYDSDRESKDDASYEVTNIHHKKNYCESPTRPVSEETHKKSFEIYSESDREEQHYLNLQHNNNNFHFGGLFVSILLLSFNDVISCYQTIFVSFQLCYTLWILAVMNYNKFRNKVDNDIAIDSGKKRQQMDKSMEEEYKLLISSSLGRIKAPPPLPLKINYKSTTPIELLKSSLQLVDATGEFIECLNASIYYLSIESSLRHGVGIYSKSIARLEAQRHSNLNKIHSNSHIFGNTYKSRKHLYEILRQISSSLLCCVFETIDGTETNENMLSLLQYLEINDNDIGQIMHFLSQKNETMDIIISFLLPPIPPSLITLQVITSSKKLILLILSFFVSSIYQHDKNTNYNKIQDDIQHSIKSTKEHVLYVQSLFSLCADTNNQISHQINNNSSNDDDRNDSCRAENNSIVLSSIEEFRRNVDALHVILWIVRQSVLEDGNKEDLVMIQNMDKIVNDNLIHNQRLQDYFLKHKEHNQKNQVENEEQEIIYENDQSNEICNGEHKYYYETNYDEDVCTTTAIDQSNLVIASEKEVNTPLEGLASAPSLNTRSYKVLQRLEPQRIQQQRSLFFNDLKRFLVKRNGIDRTAIDRENSVAKNDTIEKNTQTITENEVVADNEHGFGNSRERVLLELDTLLSVRRNNETQG